MKTLYYEYGYIAWPSNRFYPPAGTQKEGWHHAQRESEADNSEWEYGRDTYAQNYRQNIVGNFDKNS